MPPPFLDGHLLKQSRRANHELQYPDEFTPLDELAPPLSVDPALSLAEVLAARHHELQYLDELPFLTGGGGRCALAVPGPRASADGCSSLEGAREAWATVLRAQPRHVRLCLSLSLFASLYVSMCVSREQEPEHKQPARPGQQMFCSQNAASRGILLALWSGSFLSLSWPFRTFVPIGT